MIYLDLFLGFLKVGCFSFGGAFAAIPLIRDVVMEYGWLTDEALTNMIAVGESTPGPIMVNLATYVGSSQGGAAGAALATFAVVLPAFLIILAVVYLLGKLMAKPGVQAVLTGLKACVIGVILVTGIQLLLGRIAVKGTVDLKNMAMMLLLGAVMFGSKKVTGKQVSPICFMGIAAVAGMIMG